MKPLGLLNKKHLDLQNSPYRSYSINHDNTNSIISKGLNHSSIRREVKLFLESNRHLNFPVLFQKDSYNIPKGFNSYSFNDISNLSEIKNKAGIYIIRIANSTDFYIGSATDLSKRFIQHRNKSRILSNQKGSLTLYNALRQVDSSSLSLEVLKYSSNFIFKFKELNPEFILNENEIELMQFISLYECAVKEQSYLVKYRPTLNSCLFATTSTRLTFLDNPKLLSPRLTLSERVHLDKDDLEVLSNLNDDDKEASVIPNTISKKEIYHWLIDPNNSVQIFNIKGVNIGSFSTYRGAAKELGVSHMVISRYGRSTDAFYSPALDMFVSVSINNLVKSGKVIHPSAKKHSNLELDLVLPEGKIFAIYSDLSNIVNTFSSFIEAAKYFELSDYRRIRRYFGTSKLINTPKGDYYFTGDTKLINFYQDNKVIPSKTIIAYDLSDGGEDLNESKKYIFISINQAEKVLNINHTTINRHLTKGTIYNGQDGRKFKFKLG